MNPTIYGPRGRNRRASRQPRAALTALALSATMMLSPLLPTYASAQQPPQEPAADDGRQWSVTLITGDRVVVRQDARGRYSASVPDGHNFTVLGTEEHLYVVPESVQPLVHSVLELELFDVRGLVEQGLDDSRTATLPVLVEQAGSENAGRLEATAAGALDAGRELPVAGVVAAEVPKLAADELGAQLERRADGAGPTAVQDGLGLAGVSHVWLDRPLTVNWDRNLDQIGAPEAWDSGHDGSGVKVAVLDTGFDRTHPDLAGRVVAEADFTGKGNADDGHGHGTHVAGMAAGSGAGNQGLRRGVAPAADLLVGKVLTDRGSGPTSAILAGMEWAVAQGADVVNMSLGGGPTDGSDPLSRALDELTRRGTLFVVAAGNSGPGAQTIGTPGAAESALTVGAVDGSDAVAEFSSRGPRVGGALKPDLAGPGVGIVAARATGTTMGTPVDSGYTAASGTSMAAPHVAGAAALVLQRHPDWTPAQVKAALGGTAEPKAGVGPLDQGAGRIDLPDVLTATVLPEDEDLDLGLLAFPQTGPVTGTAAWRNDGAEPVTLDLAMEVRDAGGAVVPADQVRLSTTSVTVPAGGRAEATVTVDPRLTRSGQHTGYLTATVRGGDRRLHTPVGFHDEQEMYDLTLRGTDREGKPLGAQGTVTIFNVDDLRRFLPTIRNYGADGTVRLRVPKGRYHVDAFQASGQTTRQGDGGTAADVEFDFYDRIIEPEIVVDESTVFELHGRGGERRSTRLEGVATDTAGRGLDVYRTDGMGGTVQKWGSVSGTDPYYYSVGRSPVTVGTLEFAVTEQLVAPLVGISASSRQVRVAPMAGAPLPTASGTVGVVDVGAGSSAEFATRDVRGRIAVARRGLPVPLLEANAKAAGAAMLALVNDRPGFFVTSRGGRAGIPAVIVDGDDAAALRKAVRGGVRLTTTVHSPVTYDFYQRSANRLPGPAVKVYSRAEQRGLARVDARYHQFGDGIETERSFADSQADVRRPLGLARRVEHFTANVATSPTVTVRTPQNSARYTLQVWFRAPETFRPGQSGEINWLRAPLRPGIGGTDDLPITRTRNALDVRLTHLNDGDGNFGFVAVAAGGITPPTQRTVLYREGVLVDDVTASSFQFPVPPERSDYRLEIQQGTGEATALQTSRAAWWEFRSGAPTGETAVVSLPLLDFDFEVDAANRFTGREFTVTVVPQDGQRAVQTRQVTVAFSTDDGRTWQRPVRVSTRGDATRVVLPRVAAGEVLSFRVGVATADRVRHEETVLRAVQVG